MNDLAEKALAGLDVARRWLAARPTSCFAVLGFGLSTTVMIAGARVNAAHPTRPLTSWLGLQNTHGARASDIAPAAVMLAAIAALVLLWLAIGAYVERHGRSDRQLWSIAGAWALPFMIGPPLLGTTAHSYAAFGLLQRHGFSPYDSGASRLGAARVVAAIDPASRNTASSVGPLGSLLEHLAVSISAGSALGAVIALRVVAVLATVLMGRAAADLAGPHRARALTLTILNPLVLLYVVSGEHFDGLMVALLLVAIGAASQRRWLVAIVVACVAGSVNGPAFVAVPAIITAHWLGRRTIRPWLLIGRDALVAALSIVVPGVIVSDGFGWLWTVNKQFSAHPPYSIASALANLFDPVVRGASYDDLAAGARITTMTAMVCIIAYLVLTSRQRALERTIGYSLIAMSLLAPVLYPWYLLWGTICLAPTANGTRRIAVLALCAAGCLLAPDGFTDTTTDVLTGIGLAIVAAVVVGYAQRRRDSARRHAIVNV
jgi:hypothetical protein